MLKTAIAPGTEPGKIGLIFNGLELRGFHWTAWWHLRRHSYKAFIAVTTLFVGLNRSPLHRPLDDTMTVFKGWFRGSNGPEMNFSTVKIPNCKNIGSNSAQPLPNPSPNFFWLCPEWHKLSHDGLYFYDDNVYIVYALQVDRLTIDTIPYHAFQRTQK